MLRHTFLLIFRNFKRFKSTFFINLIGLSTGLACALLIYLWVSDELSIDKFHEKDKHLFQVMESQQHSGNIRVTNSTPGLLAETLKEELPEVEHSAVASLSNWFDKFTLSVNDKAIKVTGIYVSKDYFNIFSYPLIYGDANQALADKNSIVVSEDVAKKLFDSTQGVIGKSIEFQHEKEYTISGVFMNMPRASSEKFDFALSFDILKEINPGVADWKNSGPNTFIVVKEGTDVAQFNSKIASLIKSKTADEHRTLFIRQYSKAYLYGRYENGKEVGGRIDYVRQFSIIAMVILVIACINFMNLSTAKASRRIKEVGIKKAVGARRTTLIFQYFGESMVMTFLSVTVAILIVDLCLPQFNVITGKQLVLNFDTNLIIAVLIIIFVTGIIAGSYPALYLSGFNPAMILKGKLNSSLSELWARKGLVVFQFTLSVLLIVSVLVIYNQIEFLQSKNLGYDNNNVIYFEKEGRLKENAQTFIDEIKKIPGVVNASTIGQSMVGGGNTTDIEWEGKAPDLIVPFAFRPVDYDVIEMLDLEIKEGRSFSRNFTDSMKVIFNEAGIEVMGLKDPVGKSIKLGPFTCEIVGVVRNFHYESLHSNIAPMFFILAPLHTQKIITKIEAGKERETLERLQRFYQQYNPGFAFNYRFLDQDYHAQYVAEQRVATLSKYFAGLAIIISCLGLFGLAAFTAERRLKEIGIRKVLGSSEFGIIYLLSSDFTKMVITAIVIALPVSYLFISKWLDNFAYKIDLQWWYFIGAGLLALVIAWLTVGLQTFKAARVNPAQCLKDE